MVDYGCFIRVDIFDNVSRGTILILHLREIDMMEIWKGEVSELYLQWVGREYTWGAAWIIIIQIEIQG